MTQITEPLSILLIEENAQKAAQLAKRLQSRQFECRIKTMGHCKSALAYLRKSGPYKNAEAPDIVFFDFSEPANTCGKMLKKLAFSSSPPKFPIVTFTSRQSEDRLELVCGTTPAERMFAPIELTWFLKRMRELRRQTFLSAMSQLSLFGPIVVRLPDSLLLSRQVECDLATT